LKIKHLRNLRRKTNGELRFFVTKLLPYKNRSAFAAFWGIVPKGVKLPPLEKKDGRYVPAEE
jgi:hypothetical protein